MDPFSVAGSLAGRAASPALAAAQRQVQDRRFALRMVKAAAKTCDVRPSRPLRRVVARWVRDGLVDLLCDATPSRALIRMTDLADVERVDLTSLGDLHDFVSALADELLVALPEARRDQSLGRLIRDTHARRSTSRPELHDIPASAESFLRSQLEAEPDAVTEMARLLHTTEGVDPDAGRRLVAAGDLASRWYWWQWAAIGLFADGYRDRVTSAVAFRRAVDLGAPEPDVWLAYAAIADAENLTEVDITGIADPDLCTLFSALRDLGGLDVSELPPLPPNDATYGSRLKRNLIALVHTAAADFDTAIAIWEQAPPDDPASLLARYRLAEAHLQAAKGGSLDKLQHLEAARSIAFEVRDEARHRSLPLRRDAVAVACQAALMLDDFKTVLTVGAAPPDGQADELEASGEETVPFVAAAALFLNRVGLVERLLPSIPAGHAPSLFRAQLARLDGDDDEAKVHLRAAWEEVTDWGRAVSVLLAMARELDDDLPSLASKGLDDEQATRHQSMAAILRLSRYAPEHAVARLRSYVDDNPQLGIHLVMLVESTGDRFAAVTTAQQILSVREDPEIHEYLARVLLDADPPSIDEALEHATAFARGVAGTVLEPRSRRLLAALYESAGDRPAEFRQELRWLAAHGDRAAIWASLHTHLVDGALNEIRALVDGHDFQPSNRSEVIIHLRALVALGRHDDAASAATRALDTFEDDDDLCAGILAFVHATGGLRIEDEAIGSALRQATEQFITRAPEHPAFHAISSNDLDHFVELLGRQLTDRRRTLTVGRWRARTGRLPLGLLSATIGVDYVEISLGRSLMSRGHHPDRAGHAEEVANARQALNDGIVIDTTALATAVVTDLWALVRGAFREVSVTEPALVDIVRAAEMQPFQSASSVHADASGQLFHHETDSAEAERLATVTAEVARIARTCRLLHFTAPEVLPAGTSTPRTDPWVSAIETAHRADLPLCCDDFSTRRLAASVGVRTFGLYALIDALVAAGHLDSAPAEDHRLALLEAGSVGLPLTEERWRAADISTTLRLLADGTSWIDAGPLAQHAREEALAAALDQSNDRGAFDVHALSLIGIAESSILTQRNPVEVCGAATALTLGNHARTREHSACFIHALDWTLSEWLMHAQAAGPLAAKALLDLITDDTSLDPDTGLTYVMSHLSGLETSDRHAAAAVLLGATAPPLIADIQKDIEFQ